MTDVITAPQVRQMLDGVNLAELRNGLLTLSASKSAANDFVDILRQVVEERAREVADLRKARDSGEDPDRVELKSDLGKVVWTRVSDGPGVVDEHVWGRWVVDNYPSEVTVRIVLSDPRQLAAWERGEPIDYTVEYDIRSQWQSKFLDGKDLKVVDGQVVDTETGDLIPGLGVVQRAGGLRVYANDDTKTEARLAFRSMALNDAIKTLPPPSAEFAATTGGVVDVDLPEEVGYQDSGVTSAGAATSQAATGSYIDPLAGLGGTIVVDPGVPEDVVIVHSGDGPLPTVEDAEAGKVVVLDTGPECANCSVPVHEAAGRHRRSQLHNGGRGACKVEGCSCKRFKKEA